MKTAVWFTTMKCDLGCHYCWEVQAEKHGAYKPIALGNSADKWVEAWNRLRPDLLDITGGEPFLIPWMFDFIDRADPGIRLAFTTNAPADFTQFVQRFSPSRIAHMTLSWHPSENGTATRSNNLYSFTGKALMLKERGFPLSINFVAWPEQLWLIEDFRLWFEGKGLRFHVDRYSSISYFPFEFSPAETNHVAKYLTPQRADHPWTVEHGQDYWVHCSGGRDHLNVQPDGTAHRCILEHQLRINRIGNVLDADFAWRFPESKLCSEHWRCPGCDRDKVEVELSTVAS
jgi:MoaA/NifB/PqqE/SkfB family radical SAM enzyme